MTTSSISTIQTTKREMRYRLQIPLRLVWNNKSYISVTEDLSIRGLRIRTDALPALRDDAHIIVDLPGQELQLSLRVSVSHTEVVAGSTQASVGLRLAENDSTIRSAWARYVDVVRIAGARRYAHESNPALLSLHPASMDAVEEIQGRAELGAQMFIDTDVQLCLGELVGVAVVHPESQQLFVLQATVREVWSSSDLRGAIVRFESLDYERTQDVRTFVASSANASESWTDELSSLRLARAA